MPPSLDASKLIWAATWSINNVELPLALPAPVCSPHELCRKAAKLVRKYSKAKVDDDKHLLLHWPLTEHGLIVQGGDDLRLLIKGSVLPADGVSRRFMTKERAVHIQRSAAGFTKALKGGALVDVHGAGDYALELQSVAAEEDDDDFGGIGSGGATGSYQVTSMTLRFDYSEVAVAVGSVSSGDGGGSGGCCSAGGDAAMRSDTVRNLDTGEVIHISEVEERVSLGVQPSSLRAISRHAPPRGSVSSSGLLASLLQAVLGEKHVAVALEPALLPLPTVAVQGDLLSGASLRVTIGTDAFRVGDALARRRAEGVEWVVWRRHRCAADRGEIIKRSRVGRTVPLSRNLSVSLSSAAGYAAAAAGGRSPLSPTALTYTCTVEDVGCFLSVSTESHGHGSGRGSRASSSAAAEAGDGGGGQGAGRAVSGGYVQVHPSLRDAVDSHVAAGKASFEAALLSVHKRRRGEPPMHRGGSAVGSSSSSVASRKVTVRLDGAARTMQLAWRNAVGLTCSVSKPLSSHSAAAVVVLKGDELQQVLAFTGDLAGGEAGSHWGADGEVLELVLSARRSYLIKCANTLQRDLVILTLQAYLREWPPVGCAPPPMLADGISVSLAMPVSPPSTPAASAASPSLSRGETRLINVNGDGLKRPLARAPTTDDTLMVGASKVIYGDGLEYTWFRIARTGGRSLIPYAHGPVYSPTADDFGCGLLVVAVPYSKGSLGKGSAGAVASVEGGASRGRAGPLGTRLSSGGGGLANKLAARERAIVREQLGDSDDDEGSSDGESIGAAEEVEGRFGKPSHFRLPDEVRLPDALEAKLHRICVRGAAEFSVRLHANAGVGRDGADGADDGTDEDCVLSLSRTCASLKVGWAKRGTHRYSEEVGAIIEGWNSPKLLLHVGNDADAADAGVAVAGEASGGSDDGVSTLRLTCANIEARDLLALALRYFVAEYCVTAGRGEDITGR